MMRIVIDRIWPRMMASETSEKQFFRLEQFCALHVWTCVDMSLESWAQCAETISDGVLLLLKQNYYNFLIHLFARAVWKSG